MGPRPSLRARPRPGPGETFQALGGENTRELTALILALCCAGRAGRVAGTSGHDHGTETRDRPYALIYQRSASPLRRYLRRRARLSRQPVLSGFLPQLSLMRLGQFIVIGVGLQGQLLSLSGHS
jgi:hypothetical protein